MAGVNSDVVAYGQVRNGRLVIHHRSLFDAAVRQLRDGTPVEVSVTRQRATRSILANRWYWGGIIQPIADYTGYTPNEVHEFLKAKFLPKKLVFCEGNGEVVDEYVIGGSTRKLNTLEFAEFCDAARHWAAETLSVDIPDPDPNWRKQPDPTDAEDVAEGYGAGV